MPADCVRWSCPKSLTTVEGFFLPKSVQKTWRNDSLFKCSNINTRWQALWRIREMWLHQICKTKAYELSDKELESLSQRGSGGHKKTQRESKANINSNSNNNSDDTRK
jgi:hypothetical protein